MNIFKTNGIAVYRSIPLRLAIAALLLVPVMLTGCQSSDNSETTGVASSADVNDAVEPLTLAAVSTQVSLSSDQQSQLKEALQTFNQARETQRAARANGNWRASTAAPGGEPPMMALLKDCAGFLDTKQMVELATVIKDQRASALKNRAKSAGGQGRGMHQGDKGPGFRGDMIESLTAQLGLTDDQVQALKAMHESMREEFQMKRQSAPDRGRPALDDDNGAPNFHQQMREELAKILTDAQLQKLDDLQAVRRSEHQDQMHEVAKERQTDRADFLAKVLKLDGSQKAQVETILTNAQEQQQKLHEDIANSTVDRQEIRGQMPQLREQTESEIRGLLTDEQASLFDALQALLPHGARRGPRPQ